MRTFARHRCRHEWPSRSPAAAGHRGVTGRRIRIVSQCHDRSTRHRRDRGGLDGRCTSPPPSPSAAPVPAPCHRVRADFAQPIGPAIRTVVIDPGHGGDEQGARGANGALEKDIAPDVSLRLKAAIEGRLGIRVILTRDDDRLVQLDERAAIANNNKADVFVSVHANASPSREAKGAEVFYLSLDGYGEEARKMAENPDVTRLPVVGGGSRNIELIRGTGPGPSCGRVGCAGRFGGGRTSPTHRDEPALDSAGAVPRAGLRQHACRAGGDGVYLKSRPGESVGVGRFQNQGRSGALQRDRPVQSAN